MEKNSITTSKRRDRRDRKTSKRTLNIARFSAASTIACEQRLTLSAAHRHEPSLRVVARFAGRSHADVSAHSAASAMIVVRVACYSRRRMPSPRVVKRFGGQPIR